jgi:hypothetical protein
MENRVVLGVEREKEKKKVENVLETPSLAVQLASFPLSTPKTTLITRGLDSAGNQCWVSLRQIRRTSLVLNTQIIFPESSFLSVFSWPPSS